MPSGFAQVILFLSSYAPLFAIFGFLETFGGGLATYASYGVAGGSIIGLWAFMRSAKKLNRGKIEIARAEQRDSDTIAYVVTYLLPFLSLTATTWREQLAIGLLLAVVAVLYVRSHLFYVNPILSIVGYRIFRIETTSGRFLLLISHRKYLAPGSNVSAFTLSDYVFLEG